MIFTRGDICYAVGYLARFNNSPCKSACLAAKRVLQYLYLCWEGLSDHYCPYSVTLISHHVLIQGFLWSHICSILEMDI